MPPPAFTGLPTNGYVVLSPVVATGPKYDVGRSDDLARVVGRARLGLVRALLSATACATATAAWRGRLGSGAPQPLRSAELARGLPGLTAPLAVTIIQGRARSYVTF